MRKTISLSVITWGLGLIFMPTTQALRQAEPSQSDYRLPTYDKINFEAELAGDQRVSMSWDAFEGFNDEKFQYYKIIRSYANPNPLYPEQGSIAVKDKVGDTRFADEKANRSAYYRVCAITDVKGRHCSNVVWVEMDQKYTPKCDNYALNGACEDNAKAREAAKKEAEAWNQKQAEAQKRLEEKKMRQAAEKEQRQKEWEAKKAQQNKEKQTTNKNYQPSAKKVSDREMQKAQLYEKMYQRLDEWLANFGEKLDKSSLNDTQKIERIEMVQAKFYEWEQGKEMRMKMVDHIDKGLNEMKKAYSVSDDFAEIDAFLNGLLED